MDCICIIFGLYLGVFKDKKREVGKVGKVKDRQRERKVAMEAEGTEYGVRFNNQCTTRFLV